MTQLLLKENCTVTITHSKTKDLKAECLRADIIIAAVGIPKLFKRETGKKKVQSLLMLGLIKLTRGFVGDVDLMKFLKLLKQLHQFQAALVP
ncbi:MAG: hypothetical protein Ct9H300mP5_4570 [Candidatus Pelagibacterales bacterium]|nr:MAG: hypothetical protein Ct9H300mP5_4570 [Pelagibacterales bacterium]